MVSCPLVFSGSASGAQASPDSPSAGVVGVVGEVSSLADVSSSDGAVVESSSGAQATAARSRGRASRNGARLRGMP
jgi:hypothetical protein